MTVVMNDVIVSKAQFKAKALELFRQVQETGRPLIITDRGQPVLKLVPYTLDNKAVLKALKGSVLQYRNPTEPVGEEWEASR